MARDYSSRRNNPPNSSSGKRKTPKRAKPAATSARAKPKNSAKKSSSGRGPRQNTAPAARSGTPGWVWFACGLLVAIVIGSIYYIASRPAGHGPESVSIDLPDEQSEDADAQPSKKQPEPAAESTDDSPSEPRFSFYKMLPNYKVEVPANQRSTQPAPVDAHAPHEAEASADTPAPASTAQSQTSGSTSSASSGNGAGEAGGYVIQAGAFSTHDDADHRKARLALLGVTARIVDVKTSSGKTVYRVQSGTLNTRTKAQNLAQRLKSHGIETMVRHAD